MSRSVCIACGKSEFSRVFCRVPQGVISRCNSCGLGGAEYALAGNPSTDIYGPDYFNGLHGFGQDYSGDFIQAYDELRFSEELDVLERLVEQGNILDVGCATGNFLEIARRRGWRVFGYDISEHAALTVRERLPEARVATGELGPMTFKGVTFRAITLHHVLEHIENPADFLRTSILPLLDDDGLLLVESPNFDSIEARVLREQWEDLRPEQHLWHFTPSSLQLLAQSAGAHPIRLYTLGVPVWRARLLPDYCLMLATLCFGTTYGGKVGRTVVSTVDADGTRPPVSTRSAPARGLSRFSKFLGEPLMKILNRMKMGKRLILIARKEAL